MIGSDSKVGGSWDIDITSYFIGVSMWAANNR
jgi:hypothetical protein